MKKFLNKSIAFIAIIVAFFVVSGCGKKEVKKYTVTFKSGGEEISSVIVEKGKLVEEPENPTKENYDFLGWYADTEYKTEFDFENTKIVKNTLIYARFVEKQQITFKTDGGSDVTSIVCFSNQIEATAKNQFNCSKITAVPLTSKEGHTFEGWYLDSNFNNKVEFPFQVNNRTTMYAKWTATGHQVTYVTNSSEVINPVTKDYGTTLEETTLNIELKKGAASFEGWYLDGTFNEKVTFPYTITKSITLYAKWQMKEVNVYFVDTTIESGNNIIADLNTIKYYGSTIDLQDLQEKLYSKTNYIFKGWYLDAALTKEAPSLYSLEPELDDNTSILNVYFYGKYELNNNTVSLDPNGGNFDGVTSTITFTPIENNVEIYKQIDNQKPSRLGYRFIGYKVKGGEYNGKCISEVFGSSKILTSTYNLEAQWEPVDYKIKLILNSGEQVLPKDYSKEEIVNLSSYLEDNDRIKEGYDFKGVCPIKNYNDKCEVIYKETQFVIDENANKYASDEYIQEKYYRVIILQVAFTPKLLSVVADADGGNFDYSSKLNLSNVEYGTLISDLKISSPTKEGYNWTGWKICNSDDCHNINLEEQKTEKIESDGLILTATWEIKKHTISVTGIGRETPLTIKSNIPYGTNVIISYLYKWNEQSCTNSLCIFYLGTSDNENDLIISYDKKDEGFNIGQYNNSHFIGFYNEMDTYVSSFTVNDNTLLYAKYDASKGITYSLNEDSKTYAATSFAYSEEKNVEVTIASVFMGKEVTTITKECFLNYDALKINSLIIPETIDTIEKNSFIYLLKLQKLTIPVDFNEYSFSNLFGVNDEQIISHLRYLKIVGAGLTKFIISNLEGLSSLKELQELYLPYSVDEFNEETITFLGNLQYLATFNIEEKENSNQRYLSKKEDNSFIIYDKVTETQKYTFSCKNNEVPDAQIERYSINFSCDESINSNCGSFNETQTEIGTKLKDFNVEKVPTANGYTFMGWWYYTTDEKGNIVYTEPYKHSNLLVMFAENIELYAKFVKGTWDFDNETLVSIGDLEESDKSIEIEKYYLGKEIKKIDLSNMSSGLSNVTSLTLSEGLTSINLAGKFPALSTIKMVGNMDCLIESNKCNVANILKNATGDKLDSKYIIEILHSDDEILNQITNDTFAGLDNVDISILELPTSLIFDIEKYPEMFKSLNNVSGYYVSSVVDEEGNQYWNVRTTNICLYGKVKTNNGYEWALLRCSKTNLETVNTGTIIGEEPIKQIAPYAFYKINGIKEITMVDTASNSQIHTIGKYAFANMADLKSVTLGMNVRNIDDTAFNESYNIEEYNIDKLNGVYSVMDGVLFKSYETILVRYPSNKIVDTYSIPSSVKEIAKYAFILNENNRSLQLTISENVSTISGIDFSKELSYGNEYTLNNFYNISCFEVVKENPYFESVNGILYDKDLKLLIHFGKETESTQVFLEDSIKIIMKDAFKYNVSEDFDVNDIITTILITNDPSKNINDLLSKLFIVLTDNFNSSIKIKIYYSSFNGATNPYNNFASINQDNYSFHIYTSGDLIINGEKQELNTDYGYFIYNSLILETAPSTTSSSVFKGWYLDKDYKTEAKFPLLSIKEDTNSNFINLYAKFGTIYTVNFESKGGTIFASREYVDEIKEADLPTPEKIGYTFGGWYLDSSYDTPLFNENDTYTLTLPITTLYAKWEVIMTIKIVRGINEFGGYVFMEDSKNINVGTNIASEITNYSNFNWYLDEKCTETTTPQANINGSITIYGMPLISIKVYQRLDEKEYITTCKVGAFTKLEDIEEIKNKYDELSKEYATLTMETGKVDIEENLYEEINIEDRIVTSLNINTYETYRINEYELIIYLDDAYSSVKVVIVNGKNSNGEYQFNEEKEIKFSDPSTKFTEIIKDYSNYNWYTDNLFTEEITSEYISEYKGKTLFAIPLVEITITQNCNEEENTINVTTEAFTSLGAIEEIKNLNEDYNLTIFVEDKKCQLTDIITSTLDAECGKYSAKATFNITINCENK